MPARKPVPKFRVASHTAEGRMSRIHDRKGNVAALVLTGDVMDAHQMAAGPELYERLVEVRHLKRTFDGGQQKQLLPPEALAAIDETLRQARGEGAKL